MASERIRRRIARLLDQIEEAMDRLDWDSVRCTARLASYRVNGDTGELTPLETYSVGKRPMWVLITRLGG